MKITIAITVLALFQFFFFGALVARARKLCDVQAPATSGHVDFERINRVHLNTLERLVLFLPLLWIAAQTLAPAVLAGIGAVYLAGRLLYWRAYVQAPEKRTLGNALTMLSIAALLIASIVGLFN
jgi:glutathione S-transferase